MARTFATIGVYGTTEASFFDALVRFRATHFVDIRRRRGLRGSEYAYANANALQERLVKLGIEYAHELSLAPTQAIMDDQKKADAKEHVARRKRESLSPEFAARFRKEVLGSFDPKSFLDRFPANARIVLFCVEAAPEACHRSLVAIALSGSNWKDLTP